MTVSDKEIEVFARQLTDRIDANSGKIVFGIFALAALVALLGTLA